MYTPTHTHKSLTKFHHYHRLHSSSNIKIRFKSGPLGTVKDRTEIRNRVHLAHKIVNNASVYSARVFELLLSFFFSPLNPFWPQQTSADLSVAALTQDKRYSLESWRKNGFFLLHATPPPPPLHPPPFQSSLLFNCNLIKSMRRLLSTRARCSSVEWRCGIQCRPHSSNPLNRFPASQASASRGLLQDVLGRPGICLPYPPKPCSSPL